MDGILRELPGRDHDARQPTRTTSDPMRKNVQTFCVLLGALAFILSIAAYTFLPEKRLLNMASWLTFPFVGSVTILFLILFPLSGIRQIRPVVQPGFTIVATLLVICLMAFCPAYVGNALGPSWGFAGFTFPVLGSTVLAFSAALSEGEWLLVILLTICVISLAGSAIASLAMLEDKPEAPSAGRHHPPRRAIDASNAIWSMLSFFLPFGLYSSVDPRWLCLMPAVATLAICIRKGHRWAYVTFITLACAYIWILVDKPGTLNVTPAFRTLDASDDINRQVNLFSGMLAWLIKINGYIQHVVVGYAMMMLITPASARWFWRGKIEADAAGRTSDKEGLVRGESGYLRYPYEKTE